MNLIVRIIHYSKILKLTLKTKKKNNVKIYFKIRDIPDISSPNVEEVFYSLQPLLEKKLSGAPLNVSIQLFAEYT